MKKIQTKYFILDSTENHNIKDLLRLQFRRFKLLGYKLRMNSIHLKSSTKKYKVTVCAIFKNEAPYLKEWLEFNHIIGVEHFYLFNNNSEDAYETVLNPYIESGLVTLIEWPKNQAQMECYTECINRFKHEAQWIGFIDIDEYIVPKSKNNIYELLEKFECNRGSVKFYWKMFGTSGRMDRNLAGLVSEDFTVCWSKYYTVGKCFYNTNFDFEPNLKENNVFHHSLWTTYQGKKIPPVNVFDKVCCYGIDNVKSNNHPIQINHYFTKSYREYEMKKSKGDVYFKINPHDEEYFYLHELENTEVDYSAYKFLIQLKKRML